MTETILGGDDPHGLDEDLAAHLAGLLLDIPRAEPLEPRGPTQFTEEKTGDLAREVEPVAAVDLLLTALESDWWDEAAREIENRTTTTQIEPVTESDVGETETVDPVEELRAELVPAEPRTVVPPSGSGLGRVGVVLVLALIALAGLALRIVNLGVVGLNSDESVYAGQGGALLGVGSMPEHFSIFRAHPLLLQFTMGVVFRLVGENDVAARATVSVLFGLGSVVVSYLLARELYGQRVAIASAGLLATMPYHVVVSRQVLVDAPMAFFAVLGIYLAARAVRRDSRRDLYLSFVACALAAISKEIAVLLVPVLVAWMVFGPAKIKLVRFIGPSMVFAAIGLPFPLTRLINQPSNASQFFLWQFARAPNHSPDYFLNVLLQFAGIGFVAALIAGVAVVALRRSAADQLLLWWLGTFGLFFQFWPTKLFPYLFLILPAMVIAGVAAIEHIAQRLLAQSMANVAIALSAVLIVTSFTIGSAGIVLAGPAAELEGFGDFDIEVQTFAGSREFGEWAGENTPDNARFLTIGPSLGNILRFYGARDSVALSVSTNPERRNPAYIPIENPDLAMRQMSVHYVVWDAYSADRSAFYNNRLRGYARKLGGEIVFSAWAEGDQLVTTTGPPPDDVEVRIVVWDIPGAGSTTGGQREAGLS